MTSKELAKKKNVQVSFEAISIEGGLISPDWLTRISQRQCDFQTETDYNIPKGLALRDEIGRYYRIALGLWASTTSKNEFLSNFLKQCLGFEDIEEIQIPEEPPSTYPIKFFAGKGSMPLVFSSVELGLDSLSDEFGDGTRKRTAFGLVQEFLNSTDAALWGICSDGLTLRILRDNASLTKPAWIEIDLKRIFEEDRFSDFAAFWLFSHRSRFGSHSNSPSECPLEKWRSASRTEGTRAQDQLRGGVEEALEVLGEGFLSKLENKQLREGLENGSLSVQGFYLELLRLIYRLIFLLTIEERELLHPSTTSDQARNLYAEGYGLKRLRNKALRSSAYDRYHDIWESMKIVFGGLTRGESRLGLPALGGLFQESQTPHLDQCLLDNGYFLKAIFRLSWLKEDGGISRINWRDMGPEELGSVYESLLELVPQIKNNGTSFTFARGDETKGNARKLTGSYYTPDSLVQSLLDTALDPVIENTIRNNPSDPIQALLGLSIIDPACGSGHFLLAAARRLAAQVARLRAGGTPTAAEYRRALRDVIGRCIFGVDRNPMALELARTALWLEAMTPDAPLSFVDHHLVCGDALLGLIDLSVLNEGIPNEAYKALSGDDKEVCKELAKKNRDTLKSKEKQNNGTMTFTSFGVNVVDEFLELEKMPENTIEEIEKKQDAFQRLQKTAWDPGQQPIGLAADLFMAAFLAPKTKQNLKVIPTTVDVAKVIGGGVVSNEMKDFARGLAKNSRVLHWKLKFSQVFRKGGFDVVLGNPPWERIKLQEQEFFANRSPEIAQAQNKAARQRLIDNLSEAREGSAEKNLFLEFEFAKHEAEAVSIFAHDKARYPLTGTGDVNTYALFSETALKLAAPTGRVGIIVPSGVATDDSTKEFFAHISQGRLVRLIDYENRDAIFPSVHRSFKFSLLTLGKADEALFSFFLTNTTQEKDKRRQFKLSARDIAKINPNTKTCAVFRSEKDAELTKKIYDRVPVLWDETKENGNPWGIHFATMFHMSNDSHLFRTSATKADLKDPVPLYEAKMIHQFDHRFATYTGDCEETRNVTDAEKADPNFQVTPRYWVEKKEVEDRLASKGWKHNWLMGWRDITNATNERTVIASLIPRVGVGHTLPLYFIDSKLDGVIHLFFVGLLNSLVFDYVARQKVGGTHLTYGYLKQLPVIAPKQIRKIDCDFVGSRVLIFYKGLLENTAILDPVVIPQTHHKSDDKALFRAEIDAYLAALYGITREDLQFILDPIAVMGEDYPTETFRVLKNNETKCYGEYRTKRLVLEAWDNLKNSDCLPSPVEKIK